jgi:WD40 repeat protein
MFEVFGRIAVVCMLLTSSYTLNGQQQIGQSGIDLYGDPLPAGALARLGTTRFRRGGDWGQGLALTPDGAMLIAASDSHSVFCWDTATGRLIREIKVEPMNVRGFALAPDGRHIAVAGFWYTEDRTRVERQVRILDPTTGQTVQTLNRTDSDVDDHEMEFTPDGKLLISLGTGGILRVEELATGTEILQEKFARDNSPSLALSPDGSTIALATGANTGKFYLWKWQSGEQPRELKTSGTDRTYGALAFSPDGAQLAASLNHADHPIQIWEVASGKLLHRLALPEPKTYARGKLVYAPDGQTLAVPGYRNDSSAAVAVHFWNPINGKYQGQMDVAGGGHLAMSADGRFLAVGGDTGARVWKWPSREEIAPNDAAHRGSVGRVATTINGEVVTASDDGTIRVWDPATQRQRLKLQHSYWVRDIAVSPDGSRLASSALDDTVRLWDLVSGQQIYRLPGHGRMGGTRAVAFAPDGQSFGSFGDDCYLRIWDVRTGKALIEHKIRPTGVKIPDEDDRDGMDFFHIDQARFSPDASLFSLSIGKHFVFRTDSGQELLAIENRGSHVTALVVSPHNRYMLTSAWGKRQEIKMADGRTLSTSEKSNPITLWDLSSGQIFKEIVMEGGGAGPVAFSADGERFAVSSMRPKDKITIYSTATGAELEAIDDVPNRVRSLCFSQDGRSVVSGQSDSTALVWKLNAAR